MDSKLHPAITVTNIRNFIPFVLEMESGQYTSWAELFRIHCRAFQVINHIDSPPPIPLPSAPAANVDKTPKTDDPAIWSRLDAIVLQWIYSTISNDLLHTILKPNSTAYQAWIALENIFQDNQGSRAVYLEHKFNTTRLDNHPNISSYCQTLKMLADQLANVNAPVSNQRLVLQLISGLNESFEHIATLIQQTTPLPDFYEARSKLILEETRKSHQASFTTSEPSALHTTTTSSSKHSDSNSSQLNNMNRGRGRNSRGGRGRGRSYPSGRGRGFSTPPGNNGRPPSHNFYGHQFQQPQGTQFHPQTFSALAAAEWKAVLALDTNPVEFAAIFCDFGYENEGMFGGKSCFHQID
ncbi:hypothetical protein E3N88_26219 [Mikania micrantha]|uniref:Retrotransposon Copia-like N-terminal domain-containing protein n=1 Tax=Mikania micrantha TaxID=192012 RepID=A0A5N6N8M8_9ASTR|nr:hypothetical protein E3N88_26219 [Mikania micrantha]